MVRLDDHSRNHTTYKVLEHTVLHILLSNCPSAYHGEATLHYRKRVKNVGNV